MTATTTDVTALLRVPMPSYHRLLALATAAGRTAEPADRDWAVALLRGLAARYPHVLAIGQELALVLLEGGQPDEAEAVLARLERSFANLDEETQCRWGRLFKDRGDRYVCLPWSDEPGRPIDHELARVFYTRSIAHYDQGYRVRSGHFPGINKATLLLILGTLRPPGAGAPAKEIAESESLAAALLADRPRWPTSFEADETLWHPATAGEAYLLRRMWEPAARQYAEALRSRFLNEHARTSMYKQVERIRMCFDILGVTVPPPLDDPKAFFGLAAAAAAASASPSG